jgi:hypothetical protein
VKSHEHWEIEEFSLGAFLLNVSLTETHLLCCSDHFFEHLSDREKDTPVQCSKLLLVLANTVVLDFGTHVHIFFCPNFCFEMGPPFQREEGFDYCLSVPLYWQVSREL